MCPTPHSPGHPAACSCWESTGTTGARVVLPSAGVPAPLLSDKFERPGLPWPGWCRLLGEHTRMGKLQEGGTRGVGETSPLGASFKGFAQRRLSKLLIGGREDTGVDWYFQGTWDGDTGEGMERSDQGTGHGATETQRGCAGASPGGTSWPGQRRWVLTSSCTGTGGWGSL